MPQNLSAQFVCPSPKVLDFNERRLHWRPLSLPQLIPSLQRILFTHLGFGFCLSFSNNCTGGIRVVKSQLKNSPNFCTKSLSVFHNLMTCNTRRPDANIQLQLWAINPRKRLEKKNEMGKWHCFSVNTMAALWNFVQISILGTNK